MKVRIESKDGKTKITDAETGERIDNVTSVSFKHADVEQTPTAKLEIFSFDVDLEAEASIEKKDVDEDLRTSLAECLIRLAYLGDRDRAIAAASRYRLWAWVRERHWGMEDSRRGVEYRRIRLAAALVQGYSAENLFAAFDSAMQEAEVFVK